MEKYLDAAASSPGVGAMDDNNDSELRRENTRSGVIPASLGEHNDSAGAALEGSLYGSNGDGLRGVTGQVRGAPQFLEHLPVEHCGLCFPGNLNMRNRHLKIDYS